MVTGEAKEHKSAMYAIRTEFLVEPGQVTAFESYELELQSILDKAPGFHDAVLLNSLGYPDKYVTIAKWENREAFAIFCRSPVFQQRAQAGYDLYKVNRLQEAYEVLLTVGQPPKLPGGWGQLVEWDVKSDAAAAFEASRKTLFDLRQRHGSIFMSQLLRFHGNSTRYLVIQAYESREAEKTGRTAPEIREFFLAHPASKYVNHAPVGEYYTAIQVALPAI